MELEMMKAKVSSDKMRVNIPKVLDDIINQMDKMDVSRVNAKTSDQWKILLTNTEKLRYALGSQLIKNEKTQRDIQAALTTLDSAVVNYTDAQRKPGVVFGIQCLELKPD